MFNAGSRMLYSLITLLATAEVVLPEYALRVVRVSNLVCITSIPVIIRLMLLAKRQGVYAEYMDYPDVS